MFYIHDTMYGTAKTKQYSIEHSVEQYYSIQCASEGEKEQFDCSNYLCKNSYVGVIIHFLPKIVRRIEIRGSHVRRHLRVASVKWCETDIVGVLDVHLGIFSSI
jgi:hypothetical protein